MIVTQPRRRITVIGDHFDGAGPTDTGISHAIVLAVGRGELGETFRLFPTGDFVAFGRQDTIVPGYSEAVRVARSHGYEAVERLAGGRAAIFNTGTLAFSWAIPTIEPRAGVHSRFEELANLMSAALRTFGVDARVGEVAGEYCPGTYSVNVGGRFKIVGVGQRLVRGAAHVGGVVAVAGTDRLRDILVPVYEALGIHWDPSTAGTLEDHCPSVTREEVSQAILQEVGMRAEMAAGRIPDAVVATGRSLATGHVPAAG